MNNLANNPAITADGVQIQYIGLKSRKFDAWCGSNLTWQGPGDVQLVRDPKVAGKLLTHDDIWRLYDPTAPLPSSPMAREVEIAAASGDVKTLLASLQTIMTAIQKHPTAAAALSAMGFGEHTAVPQPIALRLAAAADAEAKGLSKGLADDPLSAPPQPDVPEAPPAAAPAVPNVPDPRANANERELLMENLRREAAEINLTIKASWGPTSLRQAIDARKNAILAAAESQAAAAAAEGGTNKTA